MNCGGVSGRVNVKVCVIVGVVACVLVGGAWGGHVLRRRFNDARALAAGTEAFEREAWAEAAVELREYLSNNHDDVEVAHKYALARLRIRPFDPENLGAAVGAYRTLLQETPDDPFVYEQLARLYTWLGDYGNLAYIARTRLAARSAAPEATVWLGRAQMFLRRDREARRTLETFVARREKGDVGGSCFVEACALLAAMTEAESADLTRAGERALRWLDLAVKHCPQEPAGWLLRAQLERRLAEADPATRVEERSRAEADLEMAEAMVIVDPSLRLLLCDEWLACGRLDRAAAAAASLVQATAEDVEAHFVHPDEWDAERVTRVGELAIRTGEIPAAIEQVEAVLDRLTHRSLRRRVLPLAIRLNVAASQPVAAREHLTEYLDGLKVDPAAGVDVERIALLKTAVLWVENRPYGVIDALEPIVAAGDVEAVSLKLLAQAYSQTAQPRRAIRLLRRYLQARPDDGAMMLQAARLYAGQGDWTRANQAVRSSAVDQADPDVKILRMVCELHAAAQAPPKERSARLERLTDEAGQFHGENPRRDELFVLRAQIELAAGDDAAAEVLIQKAAAAGAASMKAALDLVDLFRRTGHSERAVAAASRAIVDHGAAAEPHLALAELHAAAGRAKAAIDALQAGAAKVADPAGQRDLERRWGMLEALHGDRAAGVERLKRLAAADGEDLQSRDVLLRLPEVRADAAAAQALIDDIRRIQGETGLLWREHQAALHLASDRWRRKRREIETLLAPCLVAEPAWSAPVVLLGRLHRRLGDPARAEALYRRLLEADPGAMDVIDRLLGLLQQQRRYAEAAQLLDDLAAAGANLSGRRARLALLTGDVGAAVEQLTLRVEADAVDVESRILLARLTYQQTGNAARALAYLDEAEVVDADSMAIAAARVAILRSDGQFARAMTLLDEKVRSIGSFEAWLLRAGFHAAMGDLDAAEADYRRLVDLGGARGYEVLAAFYRDRGRRAEAIETLEAGRRAWPHNRPLLRSLAAMLIDGSPEDQAQAGACLDVLEAGEVDDPDTMVLRAAWLRAGGGGAAITRGRDLLEKVLDQRPTSMDAHRMLIETALERDEYRQTRDLALRALGAHPGHPRFLLARAVAEYRLKRPDVAKGLLEEVLRADPDDAEALAVFTDLAIDAADAAAMERMDERLGAAIARTPADGRLAAARARLAGARENVAEAVVALETFCQTPGGRDRPLVMLTLARLYEQRGNPAAAGRWIDRAAAESDEPAVVRERLLWLGRRKSYDAIAALAADGREGALPQIATLAASLLAASSETEHVEQAMRAYRLVIETYPRYVRARHGLGVLTYAAGDVGAAIEILDAALELAPENAEVLNDLAWILHQSDRDRLRALELAALGVSLEPDNDHLRDTRGEILAHMGRLQEACRDFLACLRLRSEPTPDRGRVLLKLGRLYAQRGETAKAQRYMAEALQIDRRYDMFAASERAEIDSVVK